MVIDCGAVSGVPPFRLPPRCAMEQTMLFTAMPFSTFGVGAAQVTVPSAGWLEIAVMVPMVNRAGSDIVKVTLSTTVDVVFEAVNVCVVAVNLFIDGLADEPETRTATVGPGPPCGGACGVAMLKVEVPVTGLAATSVALKVAVPVTLLLMILTITFTVTVAPAASVPMLQLAAAAVDVQVPCPARATTTLAPSGVAWLSVKVSPVAVTAVAVLLVTVAVKVARTGTEGSATGAVSAMVTFGWADGVTAFDGVDSMLMPPA